MLQHFFTLSTYLLFIASIISSSHLLAMDPQSNAAQANPAQTGIEYIKDVTTWTIANRTFYQAEVAKGSTITAMSQPIVEDNKITHRYEAARHTTALDIKTSRKMGKNVVVLTDAEKVFIMLQTAFQEKSHFPDIY
ncbi:MAG: hypothetical protein AB7F19_06260 [Candidatus Babeliales bacterium]